MNAQARQVLEFWFGEADRHADQEAYLQERQQFWFRKSADTDATIRDRFGDLLAIACHGGLTEWEQTAQERLALILILDQFSRNVYRDTPAAFTQDARALRLSLDALDSGMMMQVNSLWQMFYLMPLEHAEDLAVQNRCVKAFEALADAVPEQEKAMFRNFASYAVAHQDVIAEFGRFPHRNVILGRESTATEKAYLAKPGAGF